MISLANYKTFSIL